MTTCVSSVNTHTVYWPQWRFLVVLNADLEQFWVQAGVRRVHFLRLSGWVPNCPSADPRLFATFWACIVTAGAWSRRGYGVVICGYGVVTARLLTRHNAVTKIYLFTAEAPKTVLQANSVFLPKHRNRCFLRAAKR